MFTHDHAYHSLLFLYHIESLAIFILPSKQRWSDKANGVYSEGMALRSSTPHYIFRFFELSACINNTFPPLFLPIKCRIFYGRSLKVHTNNNALCMLQFLAPGSPIGFYLWTQPRDFRPKTFWTFLYPPNPVNPPPSIFKPCSIGTTIWSQRPIRPINSTYTMGVLRTVEWRSCGAWLPRGTTYSLIVLKVPLTIRFFHLK